MTTSPPPSPEREKEYKRLRESHDRIYNIIKDNIGEELSLFDLVNFSAQTLLKASPLFPDVAPVLMRIVRDTVTLSLQAQEASETNANNIEGIAPKPLLFDASGNKI